MTKSFSLVLLLLALCSFQPSCFAQFVENFDDGNFTESPVWVGDESLFIVNADLELNLNDINFSQSEAFLSTAAKTGLEANWNFKVQLDFSPSGSNFCRIYLNSSQDDLTQSLNGYYVQLGGISGDQDAVELVKQEGNTLTTIISGTPGAVATDEVNVNVAVSRDANGMWNLQVDYTGGQNFIDEGSAMDISFEEGNFFGLVCVYTSSRSDAFRLDDINIGPIIQDLDPPSLESVDILGANRLQISFSEAVNMNGIDVSNFQMDNGITITNITSTTEPNIFELNVSPDFTNGTTYTLTAQNIFDLEGNELLNQSIEFTFVETFMAQEFDILINEFMADPTPQVGLPNSEYIELFNNSSTAFNLRDYMISSGGAPLILPDFLLAAGQYVVLIPDDEVVNFSIFGDALGLSSFPSLSNAGDEILLQDLEGNTVHQINYTTDWYQDSEKDGGGYSIELINPAQACQQEANYRASDNLSGGTPATLNSVLDLTADETAPALLTIFTVNSTTLLLTFDEPLDNFGAEEILNYTISNNLSVVNASLQTDRTQVRLDLGNEIQSGEIFGLQFQNIPDCLGNTASLSDTLFFAIPEIPEEGELLINEILFNPVSFGVDFVEIYNPTDKVFNLSDVQISNTDETVSVAIDFLILPETYVCITPDKTQIVDQYPVEDPSTIFESSLPAFPDDEGNVTLITMRDNSLIDIDAFNYSEDFHTGFLSDNNGVSLERISFSEETDVGSNWTSAAQSTGFATPGFQNSQVIGEQNITASDFFEIVNPTFSPDQDGFKDFTQLNFTLDQVDYFGSITIYDDEGREIAQVLPFQTLSPSGTVRWDGTDLDGNVANMGIYILYIQLVDPNGNQMEFKEPVVLARRLN